MSERFTYIGSAYLFLIKDNQILLQRRCNTGFEDGNYGVPAGHMDGNETARQACLREIKEEIAITIHPEHLTNVHTMHRKALHDERIDFFFVTSDYSGEILNNEPHKCDHVAWFALDDLPPNIIAYVRVAIEHWQNGITYSEYGWE